MGHPIESIWAPCARPAPWGGQGLGDANRPQLEETEKAYLAGIIDGEGYIGLQKSPTGTYSVRLAVNTTSETLAKWIHNTTKCGKKIQERAQAKWKRQKT